MIELGETFNMAAYLVDRHIEAGNGGRPAIRCQGNTWSYADLLAQVNRTANALTALGLQMEQRCLILLPDCPEFHASFLGAMKMGAVPVPVNRLAPAKDFLYYLNDSRARVAIVHPDAWERLDSIRGELRDLKHILMLGDDVPPACESYEQLMQAASPEYNTAPTSPDDASYW